MYGQSRVEKYLRNTSQIRWKILSKISLSAIIDPDICHHSSRKDNRRHNETRPANRSTSREVRRIVTRTRCSCSEKLF
jgi:hypothetical protein